MAQPRYIRTTEESEGRKGKRIVIGLLALLLLFLGAAWAMGWFGGGNRAVAEVEQLQNQLADPALKDADRRLLWRQMREKMDALSPEQREAAWESGRDRFEQRMNEHIKEVLAMPKADQAKALDSDIDRMQQWDAHRGNRNNANNRQPGYRSDADRMTQLANRLDRSTPQTRAMRQQFRQLIQQRMQQRGITPPRRWG